MNPDMPSFHTDVYVSAMPATGQMVVALGPVGMENMPELLDYLASDPFREGLIAAAAKAMMGREEHP